VLSTGKGLKEKLTEIIIEFDANHKEKRNKLTFQIQPEEGINLELNIKEPGFETLMKNAELYFEYQNSFKNLYSIDAYEIVLVDALRNDQSLFASDQEVLRSWQILDPVVSKWANSSRGMKTYIKGTDPENII
jgi:glucose-6-phosphate 1-dehydrogenase